VRQSRCLLPTLRLSGLLLSVLLLGVSGAKPMAPVHRARSVAAARQEPAAETITYDVTPQIGANPPVLQVAMRFAWTGGPEQIAVQMPVWSPGDYHIQNHARYVRNLRAWAGSPAEGRALAVSHTDANTWQIDPGGARQVTLTYALPETPPGIFCANVLLRPRYAFYNGPAVYLYRVGQKEAPSILHLHLPPGWQAETPLERRAAPASEGLAFAAPNYDTLADSPVVMGDAETLSADEFELQDVPHRVVFYGEPGGAPDVEAALPLLRRIVQTEAGIMGGMPYARYDFLFYRNGGGEAGLEHLNACHITLWPGARLREIPPMAAHEFFHLWNVKRIRPLVLGPFDYIHPPRTRNLWFCEGVTEYYARIALRRSGLIGEEEFLDHWREAIRALQSNPARLKVTADEASWRVWEEGQSRGYGGLDYYAKGELIGLCLDLKIRGITGNQRSLDDVMRYLLRRYGLPKPGYGEDGLREAVSAVAGQDLSAFYDRLARSTQEMPFAECLAYAGLTPRLTPLRNATPAQAALRASWMAATLEALGKRKKGDRNGLAARAASSRHLLKGERP